MADSKYQHLIDIIYSVKNAEWTKEQIGEIFKLLDDGTKKTDKSTKKMGDFERALRRAAIVAPVWMILRNAMTSFFQGFSQGFQLMEEFDRAMLKAQAVSHGVIGDMGAAMQDLEGRIRNLSATTGESMTKIANAFYQFGTIGLDFEKSWQGAEASTRFAMATQEDSAKVAKTLAMTFKLLGETVDKNIPPQQAMEVQLAKMYKLWQLNAGEAGDLTAALAAFLPTANTMNLTMDETLALLSTLQSAALLGSRGGNLLRTSFSKLIENADKLASSLGLYVNPDLETSFSLFMKVLGAIKQLNQEQLLPIGAQEIITDVFGGVRGGEPIKALTALFDELQVNLGITTKGFADQQKTLEDYNKRIQDVTNSVSTQLAIFRQLRTQVFEQFITGVLGADDYAKAMQKVNIITEQLTVEALKTGEALNTIGREPIRLIPWVNLLLQLKGIEEKKVEIRKKIQDAFDEKISIQQTIELSTQLFGMKDFKKEAQELKNIAIERSRELGISQQFALRLKKYEEQYLALHKEVVDEEKKGNTVNANVLRKLELQNKELHEQLALIKLQAQGYSDADIAVAEIALEVSKIVEEFNSLDAIINGTIPALDKQRVLSMVLSENWDDVLHVLEGYPPIQEKIFSLAKKVNSVELEKQKILNTQKEQFIDLYVQYQKADALEKGRIRRLIELQNVDTSVLQRAFQTDLFDRNLILEYWNTFSQEGQTAVGEIIRRMNNLPTAQVQATISGETAFGRLRGAGAFRTPIEQQPTAAPIQQTTNIGAQNVEINVTANEATPEEMADLVSKRIKDGLLDDDEFQKAFGKRISNKV
jgi:TP901 family phage tail tape measure protein